MPYTPLLVKARTCPREEEFSGARKQFWLFALPLMNISGNRVCPPPATNRYLLQGGAKSGTFRSQSLYHAHREYTHVES